MPDPIPGSTPEEEINPQADIDISTIQRWCNISREKDLSEEDREKVRQEYVNQLENIYTKFTSQYGEVKATTLKDFLASRANLGDLFLKHEEYEKSDLHYDLGYRFLIDAIINSDINVGDGEKEKLANYFMSLSPYYKYKNTSKAKISNPITEFVSNYSDKDKLHTTLEYLYKKCRKMRFIASPFDLIGFIDNDNRDAYISWEGSLPESYKELKNKADLADDSMANPDFYRDLLIMIELLDGKKEDEISSYNSEVKKKLEKEAEEEFFQETEKEFGGSFRLPESLLEE